MKPRALTCLLLVFVSFGLGCVHVDRDLYRGANAVGGEVVWRKQEHPCIEPGADVVLRWSRFAHNPLVPFSYGGWAITLQVSSHDFVEGREFSLPTPNVAATLSFVGHHPPPSANDVGGHLRIIAVKETYADVLVDLNSASGRWAVREEATLYVRAPNPKRCA